MLVAVDVLVSMFLLVYQSVDVAVAELFAIGYGDVLFAESHLLYHRYQHAGCILAGGFDDAQLRYAGYYGRASLTFVVGHLGIAEVGTCQRDKLLDCSSGRFYCR